MGQNFGKHQYGAFAVAAPNARFVDLPWVIRSPKTLINFRKNVKTYF